MQSVCIAPSVGQNEILCCGRTARADGLSCKKRARPGRCAAPCASETEDGPRSCASETLVGRLAPVGASRLPAVLQRRFAARGAVRLINAGVSGTRARRGRPRLAVRQRPMWCGAGANDGWWNPGASVEKTASMWRRRSEGRKVLRSACACALLRAEYSEEFAASTNDWRRHEVAERASYDEWPACLAHCPRLNTAEGHELCKTTSPMRSRNAAQVCVPSALLSEAGTSSPSSRWPTRPSQAAARTQVRPRRGAGQRVGPCRWRPQRSAPTR